MDRRKSYKLAIILIVFISSLVFTNEIVIANFKRDVLSPNDEFFVYIPSVQKEYDQSIPTPPGPTPTPPPVPTNAIIVDHQSVDLFEQIPESYLLAARNYSVLHRHASVGWFISFGLDCLNNYFPDWQKL